MSSDKLSPWAQYVPSGTTNGSCSMEMPHGNRNRPRTSPAFSAIRDPGRNLVSAKSCMLTKKGPAQRLSASSLKCRGSMETEKFLAISPGYSMKRTKDRIEVTLDEQFFGRAMSPVTPSQGFVEDLQEQIAKLTALLEQETSEHQKTRKRLTHEAEEKVVQLQTQKEDEIRILQEEHAAKLFALKQEDNAKLSQEKKEAESRYEELHRELDLVKSSFKTYQESLSEEVNEEWLKKEAKWKESSEEKKLMELSKQRQSLLDMFETQKKEIQKRALEEQAMIQQSHEAHIEEAWKKYREATQETKMMNVLKMHLQTEINDKNEAILAIKMELKQAHEEIGKLKSQIDQIEKNFDQSVSKVESRYKNRIQTLMNENSDLRRKLITKNEQLYSERNRDCPGT
ncbi:PREDICTED: amyotrophic lateral sclerosis 2 chromosomal region candidate gene 12 protein [Nanorana parkeri]|uniref:amyotrophic lateral sclerosis 2 chromosomal region candidate gene 12 protein n=1 Tax=Nanorana parkeri TaxID=125878 RepID=UPI000854B265|nr:PREDICTED: amyotrophic lateral sclerosis 2 chromosomal region candidate gene 12 protein [Nanorana parkeri]